MALTNSQVDRLGDRLKKSEVVAAEDAALYHEFRAGAADESLGACGLTYWEDAMNGYLLTKNRTTDELAVEVYADRDEAIRVYNARELAKSPEEEVVLLFAESDEHLKRTHSRFFYSLEELVARKPQKARAAS
jgi:hypothetical protein